MILSPLLHQLNGRSPNSIFLTVWLFLFLTLAVTPAQAFFTQTVTNSGDSIKAGDWTGSKSEARDNLADYTPSRQFDIEFIAWDDYSNVSQVSLYYNYNDSGWRLFATQDVSGSDVSGVFEFTSPLGDGLYDFATISVDEFGNNEDSDDDGVPDRDDLEFLMADTTTIVDTTPPSTILSLGEYGSLRQNTGQLIKDPSFEATTSAWIAGGDGDHATSSAQLVSGDQSFELGFCRNSDYPIGTDWLEQSVDLTGELMSTLSFWYRFYSEDLVDWDYFTVNVQDPLGVKPDSQVIFYGRESGFLGDGELTDWIEVTYPLDSWLGQEIKLRFAVKNSLHAGDNTCVYLDDVEVNTSNNYLAAGSSLDVTATDASGSGVLSTECQLDNGDWVETSGPVELGDSGSHSVKCRSTDYEGNQSATQPLAVIVDDTAPIGVVIDQLMPDPLGADDDSKPNGEWVELYNNTSDELDLTDWYLTDAGGSRLDLTAERSLTTSLLLPAGGYLRFYRRVDPASTIGFELTNTGDTISLYTASGELADQFIYTEPTTGEGKTWRRDPSGSTNWVDPEPVDRLVSPTPQLGPAATSPNQETDSASPSASLILSPTPSPVDAPVASLENNQLIITPTVSPPVTETPGNPYPETEISPQPEATPTLVSSPTPEPPSLTKPTSSPGQASDPTPTPSNDEPPAEADSPTPNLNLEANVASNSGEANED